MNSLAETFSMSDSRKIGTFFLFLGVFFLFLGTLLLFDRKLLAMGNMCAKRTPKREARNG